MKLVVKASSVNGEIRAPPSKSYTHRAVICSALGKGRSTIRDPLFCDDTMATMRLCGMLGAGVEKGQDLIVEGVEEFVTPEDTMDCEGSGTSLRFFTALAALAPGDSVLTGNVSLRNRPVGVLLEALKGLGVIARSINGNGRPPIAVAGGGITGGEVTMRGDISSQFISALLLACPRAEKETRFSLSTPLHSLPYVEMTIEVLRGFGIEISRSSDMRSFCIPPKQRFLPNDYRVQGDFSSAAFLMAAGALAGRVSISNLDPGTLQGDIGMVRILDEMGAVVNENGAGISVEKNPLRSTTVDASDIPDLVPVCAAIATQAKGVTKVINADRLKIKESDRLRTTASELNKMGANIETTGAGLVIKGPTKLRGTLIDPHDDHRIAMACAVAGLVAEGRTVIEGMECISKSYPSFMADMKSIGADLT